MAIDAPLSLPLGRASINDRRGPHLRAADRELLRLGVRFFPITLGPMRMLTERGLRLQSRFAEAGLRSIESYPGAAQDLWGIPRKQAGEERLRQGLLRFGLTGDILRKDLTHDELDGITCALVGRAFLRGDYLAIGRPDEGLIDPTVPGRLPTLVSKSGIAAGGRSAAAQTALAPRPGDRPAGRRARRVQPQSTPALPVR